MIGFVKPLEPGKATTALTQGYLPRGWHPDAVLRTFRDDSGAWGYEVVIDGKVYFRSKEMHEVIASNRALLVKAAAALFAELTHAERVWVERCADFRDLGFRRGLGDVAEVNSWTGAWTE